MLTQKNYMKLEFPARSVNEGFARAAVAAFAAQLDPTLAEIGDIKTAVSEAVTNAVVHAYPDKLGTVQVRVRILPDERLEIAVTEISLRSPCAIGAAALRTSKKRESRSTRLAVKSAAAWALRSWRASWTRCGSSLCQAAARP